MNNFIYKYDMQKDTYEKIQIPREEIHLSGIKKVKDFFILTLVHRNEILLWNEQTNQVWSLEGLQKEYPALLRERYQQNLSTDAYRALEEICIIRHCFKKGEEPDLLRASGMVLDDFRSGRLGRSTLELAQTDNA